MVAVVSRPGVDSPYAWRLAFVSMFCIGLGGGAIYASRGRAVPRPGRDPLASALSEWERRNGRAAG